MNHGFAKLARAVNKRLPGREDFAGNRWLAPIAHRILSPELWRFTRRSVPRGVALGLFAGFIVPIGQIFLAGFLALPARANVSIAALVTFVTNPFTLPFWIMIANKVGRFFLRIDSTGMVSAVGDSVGDRYWRNFLWFAESVGQTAVGFVIMAIATSAVGYLVAGWAWRFWIGRKHRSRKAARAGRQTSTGQAEGKTNCEDRHA